MIFFMPPSLGLPYRGRLHKDFKVQFVIQLRQVLLGTCHQQIIGHGDQDSEITCSMITQDVTQFLRHQSGVACFDQQVVKKGPMAP
jgi:hypothetical protein